MYSIFRLTSQTVHCKVLLDILLLFFTADLLQSIKALNQQKQNQQIAFYGSTAHC